MCKCEIMTNTRIHTHTHIRTHTPACNNRLLSQFVCLPTPTPRSPAAQKSVPVTNISMTQRCPAAQKSIAHRAHKCIARADADLIHLAGRVDVAWQRLQQLVHVHPVRK
jgi:hypothetical protein